MVSISHYVYRNFARSAIAAIIAIFLTVTSASAQDRSQQRGSGQGTSTAGNKKSKRGPRAIGVVEFLPGGGMRLVPIALWIEGRYYDASLYGANPEPMAIEPQTVYEAQSLGEPTGTFTITTPKQVNGSWVADGNWQPHLAMDEKAAKQAARDAALKPKAGASQAVMTGDPDSGRPVLKRAPGSADDSSSTASTTTQKPQTQVDDHDSNRPVFKRQPSPTPASPQSTTGGSGSTVTTQAAAADDGDPNRPVLSHSKVSTPQSQAAAETSTDKAGTASAATAKGGRAYAAVSDAGQYQTRPLLYTMSPGERQVQEQQTLKLAMEEIREFAAKRNGPAIPKTAVIKDYDVRAFDLDFSSSPTVVLTAKLPVAGQTAANFTYFVTIVARVDINDQAQKIFSSVTDSRHLDAYPRMELIDALDADANGRGDLLFRQYSDTGISYGLYRVSAYQIEKIFEGGSSL